MPDSVTAVILFPNSCAVFWETFTVLQCRVLCGFTAECWDASLQCCEAEAFRSLTTLQWSIPTQCSVGMLHCRVLGSLIVVLLRLHCSVLWCLTAKCCEASLQSVVEASCRVLQCLTAECCWGLTAVCCDASLQCCWGFTVECCGASLQSVVRLHCRVLRCLIAECCDASPLCCDLKHSSSFKKKSAMPLQEPIVCHSIKSHMTSAVFSTFLSVCLILHSSQLRQT